MSGARWEPGVFRDGDVNKEEKQSLSSNGYKGVENEFHTSRSFHFREWLLIYRSAFLLFFLGLDVISCVSKLTLTLNPTLGPSPKVVQYRAPSFEIIYQ